MSVEQLGTPQLHDLGRCAYLNAVESIVPRSTPSPGLAVALALLFLRGYQRFVSPLLAVLFRSGCRFYPTCSEYAAQALSRYGVWRGTYQALRRISRCHPFHPGGHDPLPH